MGVKHVCFLLFICQTALATIYEVGPGKANETIEQVPWTQLAAGDSVLIHWRAEPYQSKWLISVRGTESAPVTIRGVPGSEGQLPVISGINALTPPGLDYWGHARSVIKIGPASVPNNIIPAYVTVEDLEIKSARRPYSYTWRRGPGNYDPSAAAIWIEAGEHISVRHCVLHDCANGFAVSKGGKDIALEGCYLYDNGVEKSTQQHNVYTEANGMTFRFNRLGPLRAGCLGNNLKDRSARTVVACNWIEGGNRELDLVDAEDSAEIRADAKYGRTVVYGNIIVEPNDPGNQIVHYGGDSGHVDWYRPGTLYFFNNTVISRRPDSTTLFRIQDNEEKVEAWNNIIYCSAAGKSLAVVNSVGQVDLRNNWIKPGWVNCHGEFTGSVADHHNLVGNNPGFANEAGDDFHLASNSPCLQAGLAMPAEFKEAMDREYVPHQKSQPRADALDLGAFARPAASLGQNRN